jgi:hypothetical protein
VQTPEQRDQLELMKLVECHEAFLNPQSEHYRFRAMVYNKFPKDLPKE